MFRGKFIRNYKKNQFSKDNSSSSIKERSKYRYNLNNLYSCPKSEETPPKKGTNNAKTHTEENPEKNKKLKENNTNKNIFSITKELTHYNNVNSTDEILKEKKLENEKVKENNNCNDLRKKINFRERLNNSRKKRAFFNNNNNNEGNNYEANNNNNNITLEKGKKKSDNYINVNLNNNKEEKKDKKEENIINVLKKNDREKKRYLKYEAIKENEDYESQKEEKTKNYSNVMDIKEENIGNEISDTVKCHMCFQKMVHPKMCPKCHHISCEKCLYNWFLKDQNKECNYCKEAINFYDLISVPFMDTIVDFVEKVIYDKKKYSSSFQNTPNYNLNSFKKDDILLNNILESKETCDIHDTEPLYYYCINCRKGYCKTCFVFFGKEKDKHVDHNIIEYSLYKKLNLPILREEEEKLDYNLNQLNNLINQCNSYKIFYDLEKKSINDYISLIQKELNKKMDNLIKNIENKIIELNQCIEIYHKSKKEIDDFYKNINIKNATSLNSQFFIDKIEKINNKNIINEKEINKFFIVPENMILKIHQNDNEEINTEKYINKKIRFKEDIEMTIDNKKKNCVNINLNIPKDNLKNHLYNALIYFIKKDENIIYGYTLDDVKEGKNYFSIGKKIQIEENEFSVFKVKTLIYDFYYN